MNKLFIISLIWKRFFYDILCKNGWKKLFRYLLSVDREPVKLVGPVTSLTAKRLGERAEKQSGSGLWFFGNTMLALLYFKGPMHIPQVEFESDLFIQGVVENALRIIISEETLD